MPDFPRPVEVSTNNELLERISAQLGDIDDTLDVIRKLLEALPKRLAEPRA